MSSFSTNASSSTSKLFDKERLILVGTYSQDLGFVKGQGDGIYAFRLTGTGTFGAAVFLNRPVVSRVEAGANPTYLCRGAAPGVVYAVDEQDLEGGGRVRGFRVTLGENSGAPEAAPLGPAVATGDSSPCHLVATPTRLYVANYCGGARGTGSASSFALEANGAPSDAAKAALPPANGGITYPRADKGVIQARQDKAHAHMTLLSADGSGLLVPDLGSDVVWRLAAPALDGAEVACRCTPGDGPRHAAWHPTLDVVYVLCELSCRVLAFGADRATGRGGGRSGPACLPIAAARTLPPDCYPEGGGPPTRPESTCAALLVHPNGKWLYCSNRAVGISGLVTRFEIDPEGLIYEVDAVHIGSGGTCPREIAFAGPNAELLLVANQDSNCILSFSVNPATGALVERHRVACPTPVCCLDLGTPPAKQGPAPC